MTMPLPELVDTLRAWDFSQGGPWHGHARAVACMKQAADEIDRLNEALLDATAHIVGMASAYRKHAARHRSVGRAQADPFFTTRADDFDKAAARAQAALTSALSSEDQS